MEKGNRGRSWRIGWKRSGQDREGNEGKGVKVMAEEKPKGKEGKGPDSVEMKRGKKVEGENKKKGEGRRDRGEEK